MRLCLLVVTLLAIGCKNDDVLLDEDRDQDGYVTSVDCNDYNAAVHPAAEEVCNGLDDDCDGGVDVDASDAPTWYADADGDGFGDAASETTACQAPAGYAPNDDDCDDADASAHPGGTEVCDGADNDCNASTDGAEAVDALTWYADTDLDGWGDPDTSVVDCTAPTNYVRIAGDCDPTDGDNHPGADEWCDDDDNDCDGDTDEAGAVDADLWYLDDDEDGYGVGDDAVRSCDPIAKRSLLLGDCDDSDEYANPGEDEVCDDNVDNDCDTEVDEPTAVDAKTWHRDADGDLFADADAVIVRCEAPPGYIDPGADPDWDCDDLNPLSNPDAAEICDGLDNDCDLVVDNGVLGMSVLCPAEACVDINAATTDLEDGLYWLDFFDPHLAYCDMTTDGGGWTRIVRWDRETLNDNKADLMDRMEAEVDTMTWTAQTNRLHWSDDGGNGDVLSLRRDVEVPNGGETLLDLKYEATSMDNSGTFFFVTADGVDQDIICETNALDGESSDYSGEELAWLPSYTCPVAHEEGSNDYSFIDVYQDDFGGEVTAYYIRSFHSDVGNDDSYLYYFDFYVR